MTAAELEYLVKVQDRDLKELQKNVRETNKALAASEVTGRSFGQTFQAVGSKISGVGGVLTRTLTPALALAGLGALKAADAASDVGEQVSKANVVFGRSGKAVVAWSSTLVDRFGISKLAALEAAGTFGNMLVPMGLARKEAAGMSKGLVELAGDMASFNNASPEEVLEALRSGLSGETEPLRRFGVFLNEARIRQEALNLGLVKGKEELSASAKAQAVYSLILKDTADAQGDFARTSDSAANQQRSLRAELANTTAALGQAFLPLLKSGLGIVGDALDAVGPKIQQFASWFDGLSDHAQTLIVAAGGAAAALGPFLIVIGKLVSGVGSLVPLFGALASPIGIAIAAVVAIAAAFILAYTKSETFRAWVHGSLLPALSSLGSALLELGKVILDALGAAWEALRPIIEPIISWIGGRISTLVNIVADAIRLVAAVIQGDWGKAWSLLKSIFSRAWEAIKADLQTAWNAIAGLATAAGGAIRDGFMEGVRTLQSWVLAAWGAIKDAFGEAIGFILNRVSEVIRGFADVAGAFGWLPVVGDDLQAFAEKARGTADAIDETAGSMQDWGKEVPEVAIRAVAATGAEIDRLAGKMRGGADDAVQALNGKRGAFETAGRGLGGAVGTGVTEAGDRVNTAAAGLATGGAGAARGERDSFFNTGSWLGQGLASGISSAVDAGIATVQAAIRATQQQVAAMFGISSPSIVWQDELGKPLGEGVVRGALLGLRDLPDNVSGKVREAFDRIRSTIQEHQGVMDSAFSEVTSNALSAFDRLTAGLKTKSEMALEAMELDKRTAEITARIEEAQAKLNEALASGNQEAVLAAQKQLADAEYEKERDRLQRLAEQERIAMDDRRALDRKHLEERLGDLRERLVKHPEEYRKINKQIQQLLDKFGIDMRGSGMNIGVALAEGLRDSIGVVKSAAEAVAKAISNALKTASPTKEGPMSDLDKWWVGFAPALLSGLDTEMIRQAIHAAAAAPPIGGGDFAMSPSLRRGRGGDGPAGGATVTFPNAVFYVRSDLDAELVGAAVAGRVAVVR